MDKDNAKPSTSKDGDKYSAPSSSEESRNLRAKKKKKVYSQKYEESWEKEPEFKGWLKRSKKGPTFAYCKVCDKDLVCGKSELLKHTQYQAHKVKAKALSSQQTLTSMSGFKKNIDLEDQVKSVEIRFAAFAAEHNIAFNTLDHLSELIKSSFTDSEIAKKFSSKRTKTTAIVNNVTGRFSFEKTLKLLNVHKFSLIVDESTDVGVIKNLALVVRLCISHVVEDIFLGLVPVPDGTAKGLYTTIVDFFDKYNIDWKKNLIGFASDGASVMMGVHNSLSTHLKSKIPNLFLMKCSCHSFSLCANYACEKLPENIELLARDIYTYFHQSYKRQHEFTQFQNFVEVKPINYYNPPTQDGSLLSVVRRILEQYDALILYFTDIHFNQKVSVAESILKRLKEPSTKMYYQFLDFALPFFTNLNVAIQSESIKIHTLYSDIESTLKSLLDCYLKKSYIEKTPLESIKYRKPDNFVPIENLDLGAHIMISLANQSHGLTEGELLDFRKHCLEFLIEGCDQIYKRFNPAEQSTRILKKLSILSPSEVLSKKHQSIAPLAIEFPNLITNSELNSIDQEWRDLRNIDPHVLVGALNINDFWKKISELKSGDETPMFPKLCKFVDDIFCLPHSSATVERVFSQINLNKTKIRNKLSVDTLTGIMHTKQLLKHKTCFNFPIENELIKKMNKSMYEYDQ